MNLGVIFSFGSNKDEDLFVCTRRFFSYGGNEHGNYGDQDGGGHHTDGQHYGGVSHNKQQQNVHLQLLLCRKR